jgi:hypothetical protein
VTCTTSPTSAYVAEVLRLYCLLSDTPDRPRPPDRRLAAELDRRRVPLDLIRAAFVVATARRLFSPSAPLPAIRSLNYFLPILEELQRKPVDPGYVEHLRRRLLADGSSKAFQRWLRTSIFTE